MGQELSGIDSNKNHEQFAENPSRAHRRFSQILVVMCLFDSHKKWASNDNGLFHFLSVQGDGRKIPGLVKSMNFQWSTAKSPKIPGGWPHFATKFIDIEIFISTDFSRQSCRCKQEFQGKKGKNIFQGTRLENCTSTKSIRHSKTLVVHPLTFSGGWFYEGKTCQGSFSRHYYSDDRKFHPIF